MKELCAGEKELIHVEDLEQAVICGLKRIAYAPINDAVKLMAQLQELSQKEIAELDLYAVSEIKLPKTGGCEVKFYDRLKALELLLAYEQKKDEAAQTSSFYQALENAAPAVCDSNAI